jgi:hypothetical protein
MVELYLCSSIRLYGVVFNLLSTGITLLFTLPLPPHHGMTCRYVVDGKELAC